METISQLRSAVKALGYKVLTEPSAFASGWRHATYIHIESGQSLTFNVFTPETFARWRILLEFRRDNAADLLKMEQSERTFGLSI